MIGHVGGTEQAAAHGIQWAPAVPGERLVPTIRGVEAVCTGDTASGAAFKAANGRCQTRVFSVSRLVANVGCYVNGKLPSWSAGKTRAFE